MGKKCVRNEINLKRKVLLSLECSTVWAIRDLREKGRQMKEMFFLILLYMIPKTLLFR